MILYERLLYHLSQEQEKDKPNNAQGRTFRTIAHGGPKEAEETLAAAERRYERKHENMR
ncbi:MAG: hypothetical protein NTAFB09_00210 [Nitrosospira sp.]